MTPYIRQAVDRFAVCIAPAPFEVRRPSLRLTVDTRADLQFVRSLVDQAGDESVLSLGAGHRAGRSLRGLGRRRMIRVTRLDGSSMVVNDDQIAWIDTHPDTVISMMNGEKLLVRETPDELVERARQFRRTLATQGLLRLANSREAGA